MPHPSNAAFRALADPTRRDILRALGSGTRTSGQLAELFESSWPTISRHLAVLRESGLVRASRNGQEIHYELNTSVFQDVLHHLIDWLPADRTLRLRSRRSRRQEA